MTDKLRTIRLTPYLKGHGPTFSLTTFDTGQTDADGKWVIAYRLTQRSAGRTETIFNGDDFHCSPLDAIDSDQACASLLGFLTLRPGDTDAEYFANYTDRQLTFANEHAETLAVEVSARFGDL